jgi:hypothetical protein
MNQAGAGANQGGAGANQAGAARKGPVRTWFHKCMNDKGVGCWSHHNMYTCGSWKSECTFVFGSCREFFGEPCLPGPPQPPMPPGYGPPPTYLPQPGYPNPPQSGSASSRGAADSANSRGASIFGRRSGCPSCQ